jgi:hypothetical protein
MAGRRDSTLAGVSKNQASLILILNCESSDMREVGTSSAKREDKSRNMNKITNKRGIYTSIIGNYPL